MNAFDYHSVVKYLFSRGIIGEQHLKSPSFRVDKHVTRNNTYSISTANEGFFLKQVAHQVEDHGSSFRNELLVYSTGVISKDIVPKLIFIDNEYQCFCTELLLQATPLYRERSNFTDYHFFVQRFTQINSLIELLQNVNLTANIEANLPWMFRFWKDNSGYLPKSQFGRSIIREIQVSEELASALQNSEAEYRYDGVIHGDLKLNNVVAFQERLKIVDWEFFGRGDVLYDYASVAASFIFFICMSEEFREEKFLSYMAVVFNTRSIDENSSLKVQRFVGIKILQYAIEYSNGNVIDHKYFRQTVNLSINLIKSTGLWRA